MSLHQNCLGKEEHQQKWNVFSVEKQHLNTPMMLFPTIIEYTFKFLDRIINTIEDRFDQEDFRSFVKFENLLLKAAKGYVFIEEYNDVMEIYGSDFNENRFQLQLETLQE